MAQLPAAAVTRASARRAGVALGWPRSRTDAPASPNSSAPKHRKPTFLPPKSLRCTESDAPTPLAKRRGASSTCCGISASQPEEVMRCSPNCFPRRTHHIIFGGIASNVAQQRRASVPPLHILGAAKDPQKQQDAWAQVLLRPDSPETAMRQAKLPFLLCRPRARGCRALQGCSGHAKVCDDPRNLAVMLVAKRVNSPRRVAAQAARKPSQRVGDGQCFPARQVPAATLDAFMCCAEPMRSRKRSHGEMVAKRSGSPSCSNIDQQSVMLVPICAGDQ